MGLRRLRGRISQLQNNANLTMAQGQEVIALGKDLIEDMADGFSLSVEIDEGAAKTLMGILLGKAGTLPIKIKIDPTVDA